MRALYVAGPRDGVRHILSDGIVVVGRGVESTIMIGDPRVSRAHVALEVGAEIALTDLASANGTFLGPERLAPHSPRPLAVDQPFFIGDTAMVVRATSLRRSCPQRVASLEELAARFAPLSVSCAGTRLAVIRVRPAPRPRNATWEAILGELLQSPRDCMLSSRDGQLLLGIEVAGGVQGPRLERFVSQHLASWSLSADVEATIVPIEQVGPFGEGLRVLLAEDPPLVLARGAVLFLDPAMVGLRRTLARVAPAAVNVLVLGETGAGKDVVASTLHELSPRAKQPFVGINCASVPEALLESELFGHARGAFTGAVAAKPGLLESADRGTVFLDEIGDMPMTLQAKLLRVIESREVMPVGGTRARSLDLRFVAATNRDLAAEVDAGRFRRDLYYRLNTVTVTLPPLRDRPSEIEPLARLFLETACTRFAVPRLQLSAAAVAALQGHGWPGNVRELRNVIERAVLMALGPTIEPNDLGIAARPPSAIAILRRPDDADTDISIRERIKHALAASGGNQSRAARVLQMPRRTLVRKIAQLGLPRPRSQD